MNHETTNDEIPGLNPPGTWPRENRIYRKHPNHRWQFLYVFWSCLNCRAMEKSEQAELACVGSE